MTIDPSPTIDHPLPREEDPNHPSVAFVPKPKRSIGLLLGLTILAGIVAALLALSFEGSAVWATTVDELMADPNLHGRRVRVEGTLVHGSLMKRDEPCEYRFQLHAKPSPIQVRYPQCVIPDSLQDRPNAIVKVTIEGSLNRDRVFEATQVLAKCPSKYEEQNGRMIAPSGSRSGSSL